MFPLDQPGRTGTMSILLDDCWPRSLARDPFLTRLTLQSHRNLRYGDRITYNQGYGSFDGVQ